MDKSNWKKIGFLILAILGIATGAKAANTAAQNVMRGNAKYNVVAVVLGIIFAGISVFLFYLDRRISKLEKEKEHNP